MTLRKSVPVARFSDLCLLMLNCDQELECEDPLVASDWLYVPCQMLVYMIPVFVPCRSLILSSGYWIVLSVGLLGPSIGLLWYGRPGAFRSGLYARSSRSVLFVTIATVGRSVRSLGRSVGVGTHIHLSLCCLVLCRPEV